MIGCDGRCEKHNMRTQPCCTPQKVQCAEGAPSVFSCAQMGTRGLEARGAQAFFMPCYCFTLFAPGAMRTSP